jgi:hypothetical protein
VHVVGAAARGGRGARLHAAEQDPDRVDRRGVGDGAELCHHGLDVRGQALADPDHTASAHVDGSSGDVGCPSDVVSRPDASELGAASDEC